MLHLVAHILGKDVVALPTTEAMPSRMLGVAHAALKGSTGTVQVAILRCKLPATRAGTMRENNHPDYFPWMLRKGLYAPSPRIIDVFAPMLKRSCPFVSVRPDDP
jgi:hypothetical protein